MATGIHEYFRLLADGIAQPGEFSPAPYYEPMTDSLIFYVRDEQSYGKRINSLLTLFLSIEDESLVGFEISGLNQALKVIAGHDLGAKR